MEPTPSRTLTPDDMRDLSKRYGHGVEIPLTLLEQIRLAANARRDDQEAWAIEQVRAAYTLVRSWERRPEARRQRYRQDAEKFIFNYRRQSRMNKHTNNGLQALIIAGAATVTVLTSASGSVPALRWWAAGLSAIVSATAGAISYFKFREHAHDQQATADAIEHEGSHHDLGIGRYAHLADAEASLLFAETVEALINEQRQRELALEQSTPDPKRDGGAARLG